MKVSISLDTDDALSPHYLYADCVRLKGAALTLGVDECSLCGTSPFVFDRSTNYIATTALVLFPLWGGAVL